MTLRHLVVFKAVFEELHFTRAAERLYLTQSAVSHAIKDLEEETGTVLFERRGREMAPTSYAVRFWEQASGIVEQYERLNRTIKHLQQETPLRIASWHYHGLLLAARGLTCIYPTAASNTR